MSTLVIVLLVVAAVLLLLLAGGFVAAARRTAAGAADYDRHVAEADRALELARAADRGWDRDALEEVARAALADERPGWQYEELHLVLVDDRPGVTEDRAHFVAVGGAREVRIVLVRGDEGWTANRLDPA